MGSAKQSELLVVNPTPPQSAEQQVEFLQKIQRIFDREVPCSRCRTTAYGDIEVSENDRGGREPEALLGPLT